MENFPFSYAYKFMFMSFCRVCGPIVHKHKHEHIKRVAKGFCVTRDGPKISSVMRDGAKISRVMRDWTSQRDA